MGSTQSTPRSRNTAAIDLSIACSNSKRDRSVRGYKRQEILRVSIRSEYKIVKTLDPGGDNEGAIGAMNGGVFVVKHKRTGGLYVEKRFPEYLPPGHAYNEIMMIRGLYHDALTQYSAAFIVLQPWESSIYLEFCDLGSLNGIIDAYEKRQAKSRRLPTVKPAIPEAFIWHTYIGLCDALCYLQTGQSAVAANLSDPQPNWIPILHQDLKPDNVLLRSRSTSGSKKYPYVVISDFGLAKPWEPSKMVRCGTMVYWAPELCTDSYGQYPPIGSTTPKVDVWALAATVYGLCAADALAYLDRNIPPGMRPYDWKQSRDSRLREVPLDDCYSDSLSMAVNAGLIYEPDQRPDAQTLVRALQFAEEKASPSYKALPDWAVKKHSY